MLKTAEIHDVEVGKYLTCGVGWMEGGSNSAWNIHTGKLYFLMMKYKFAGKSVQSDHTSYVSTVTYYNVYGFLCGLSYWPFNHVSICTLATKNNTIAM